MIVILSGLLRRMMRRGSLVPSCLSFVRSSPYDFDLTHLAADVWPTDVLPLALQLPRCVPLHLVHYTEAFLLLNVFQYCIQYIYYGR